MRPSASAPRGLAMAKLLFAAMAAHVATMGRCHMDETMLWSVMDVSQLLQGPSWSVAAVAAPWDARAHEALRVLAARNASAKLFDARSAAADSMMRSLDVRPPSLVVATRGDRRVFPIDEQLRAEAVADAIAEAKREEEKKQDAEEDAEEESVLHLLHEKRERTSLVSVLLAVDCHVQTWNACQQLDDFVDVHRLRTTVSILYAKEWKRAKVLLDRMRGDAGRCNAHGPHTASPWTCATVHETDTSTAWDGSGMQGSAEWCQEGLAVVQGVYFLDRKPTLVTHCVNREGFRAEVLHNQIQQAHHLRIHTLLERELRFPFINPQRAVGSSHPSLLLLGDLNAAGPAGTLSRALLRAVDQLAEHYTYNGNIGTERAPFTLPTSPAQNDVCTTLAPHMIFYQLNADSDTTDHWLAHWFQFSGELPAIVIVDPSIQEYYLLEAAVLEASLESDHSPLDTVQVYVDAFFRGALLPHRYEDDDSLLPDIHVGMFLRDLSPVKVEEVCQQGWEALLLYTSPSCGVCKRYLAMFDFLEASLMRVQRNESLVAHASNNFVSALRKVHERGTLVLGAIDCDRFFCGLGVHPVIFFVGQERGQLRRFEGSPWLQHLLDFVLDAWEKCPAESSTKADQAHTQA